MSDSRIIIPALGVLKGGGGREGEIISVRSAEGIFASVTLQPTFPRPVAGTLGHPADAICHGMFTQSGEGQYDEEKQEQKKQRSGSHARATVACRSVRWQEASDDIVKD
ncbi:hypothetical protein AAFF_G00264390 [Aldrovandia affinis]|uniref:Uncharacterized protein n=1 Tax=Aldrovandia affinis TaxID=143900 RepID=A0AAD7ST41_9TELE|nr:hypothetical protein AAFF_G00264390 [Aldrovandia affinis]